MVQMRFQRRVAGWDWLRRASSFDWAEHSTNEQLSQAGPVHRLGLESIALFMVDYLY